MDSPWDDLTLAFSRTSMFPFFDIAHYLVSVMALKCQPGECGALRTGPLKVSASSSGPLGLGERRSCLYPRKSYNRVEGAPRVGSTDHSSTDGETEAGKGGGSGTHQRRRDLGSACQSREGLPGQVTERCCHLPAQHLRGLLVVLPLPWKVFKSHLGTKLPEKQV